MQWILIINILLLWCAVALLYILLFRALASTGVNRAQRRPLPQKLFHPLIGNIAPEWNDQTLDGTGVSTSDVGKPSLIVVFDPHCGTCVEHLDKYAALEKQANEANEVFWLVSLGNYQDTLRVVDERIPQFTRISVQPRSSASFSSLFQISSIPLYFKIDAHRVVVDSGHPDLLVHGWAAE